MTWNELKWKEFAIEDLFNIKIGKNVDGNKVDTQSGRFAYITRKESNNGLDGFIDFDLELLNEDYPVITIGNETAEPFVQEFPFFTGTKVNILIPKVELSSKVLFFIATSLKTHKQKYSYSFTINSTRLKKQKILLPIDRKSEPDYVFMEKYMAKKEEELVSQYKDYISSEIAKLQQKGIALNIDKEWKEFEIGKLFKISAGKSKGLNHLVDVESGGVNYLGATNSNNGVLAYVEEVKNIVHKGNAICFIRNGEGSMGYSIYKAEKFIATSDISVGYSEHLNKAVGLFITTVADKVRGKYNFGYKRSDTRLKKEKLLLPANDQGEPDYIYMEQYMQALEYEKIKAYLNYKMKKEKSN